MKRKKRNKQCQAGHKFGLDNDQHDDCDRCNVWEYCKNDVIIDKEVKKNWAAFTNAYESIRGVNGASDGATFKSAIECLLFLEMYMRGLDLQAVERVFKEILEDETEFLEALQAPTREDFMDACFKKRNTVKE